MIYTNIINIWLYLLQDQPQLPPQSLQGTAELSFASVEYNIKINKYKSYSTSTH